MKSRCNFLFSFANTAAIVFFCQTGSAVDKVLVNMLSSNAISEELPFSVLQGKSFTALKDAIYVKIHIFPDRGIKGLTGIRVTSCKKQFTDRINAFINFDEVHSTSSDVQSGSSNNDDFFSKYSPNPGDGSERSALISFGPGVAKIDVRSVTLNFNTSTDLCIEKVELISEKNQVLEVQTPLVVSATVSADSILEPKNSYDPFQLFDSRYETGWATNRKAFGSTLSIDFKNEVTIETIKIWNGYQRSLSHCQANSRPKKIKLKMENTEVELALEDKLGSQELKLPKILKGKSLKLIVVDSFHGSKYEEMVISELRFFNGANWFMPDPLPKIQDLHLQNRSEFAKAGLEHVLNHDLSKQFDDEGSSSNLRIRSDGTFYYAGSYVKEDSEILIDSLGSFEIKKVEKDRINLRLFGYYKKRQSEWGGDCNGCGFKCNATDSKDKDPKTIFQEEFLLKKSPDGKRVLIESLNKKSKLKMSKDAYNVL